MTLSRAYLDYNATAPLRPEARTAMAAVEGTFGNPSSVHAEGRAARALMEDARAHIANILHVAPGDVIFTSGGSESAATILSPQTKWPGNNQQVERLLIGASEHDCVLSGHRFPSVNVETLPLDRNGIVDIAHLAAHVEDLSTGENPSSPIVALQAANNETGIFQPLADVKEVLKESGALLVVDAVQWVGRMPCDPDNLPADALFVSSHKLGGPMGIGALALRREGLEIDPLMHGGGQERRRRAGTENPAAIVGFAAALDAAVRDREIVQKHIQNLRDKLEDGVKAATPEAIVVGAAVRRLQNTSCIVISGLRAETAVIGFDLNGIAISSGSACSSGKVGASHVLEAMGMDDGLASGAIRISLGWETSEDEIERFLKSWRDITRSLEERRRGAA
jgi:cysteine desulfurase